MAKRQQQLEAEARLLNSGLEWWRTISRDHQLSWTVRDVSIHDVDGMHRAKAGKEGHLRRLSHRESGKGLPGTGAAHGVAHVT